MDFFIFNNTIDSEFDSGWANRDRYSFSESVKTKS